MNFHELKQVVHQGNPEVHILSNQGDLYLVQIFNDGGQSLLTKNHSSRPVVFHGLPECYEKLSDAGLHKAFVDQAMAFDEMINLEGDAAAQTDHQAVCF
ncbi:MAG: DUF6482 family protein [Oleispira sp.]